MQHIKAIIDIGNGYIKTIILGQDEDKTVLLRKDMRITKGLRKGNILDKQAFTELLESIIQDSQNKLGGDYVDEYIIGISHPGMRIARIQEQKRVMGEKIVEEDVQHLSNVIADIAQKDGYEVLKIIPIYWILDEAKREKDPTNIKAKKLDIVADIFSISTTFYNTIVEVIDKLGLYVTDIIPNILATAETTLDYDMKDLGTVTIDIGKNQTSYIIYEEGYPLYYGILQIGAENITRDISIGMQIDIKEAEKLKINYATLNHPDIQIQDNQEIDTHFLANIVTARYEEIFQKIQKKLIELDKDGRLAGGVILSGGGSKISHLDVLAKDIFKVATFYGTDKNKITKELANNVQFVNALGLYERSEKYAMTKKGRFNLTFKNDLFKKIGEFIKNIF